MSKLSCLFGMHDWKIVKSDQSFHTKLTWDTPGDCGTVWHKLHYLECRCCGVRSLKSFGKGHKKHSGIKSERFEWEMSANQKDKTK